MLYTVSQDVMSETGTVLTRVRLGICSEQDVSTNQTGLKEDEYPQRSKGLRLHVEVEMIFVADCHLYYTICAIN